jgi:hypothetical protein
MMGEILTLLGLLERANLSHWAAHARVGVTLRLTVYRH